MRALKKNFSVVIVVLFLLTAVFISSPQQANAASGGYVPVELSRTTAYIGQGVGVSTLQSCLLNGNVAFYWSTSESGTPYYLGGGGPYESLVWNDPLHTTGTFYFYAYFTPSSSSIPTQCANSMSTAPQYATLTVIED